MMPPGLRDAGFLLPRFDSKRVAHSYRSPINRGIMIEKLQARGGQYWNLRGSCKELHSQRNAAAPRR